MKQFYLNKFLVVCPKCGKDAVVQNEHFNGYFPRDGKVAYSNCLFKPKNEPYQVRYQSSGVAADPLFNLPFWLQAVVKDNLLWAYNRLHLHDIKIYVQAKLRERQSEGYTTMVERFPTFIKEAKNRDAILKAIGKMEKR